MSEPANTPPTDLVVSAPAPPPPPPYAPAPVAVHVPQPVDAGIALPANVNITSVGKRVGCALLDGLLLFVTLYIGWFIWAAILAGNGQTPAKKLLGVRVVSLNNGQPATFATMLFMRGIVGQFVAAFAFMFTLGVLMLMPVWDRRNQSIYEKVSSTIVVDDAFNAWGR